MNVKDIFDNNLKMPLRKDLMSLSCINEKDTNIKKFKQINTKRNFSLNLYNLDIEGSSPKILLYTNKIDFINKIDDIEKSSPTKLFIKPNKPEYNLSNEDIEKSTSNFHHLNTKRFTNPLNPKYILPQGENNIPLETNKFLRDQIDVKDIEKASPNKLYKYEIDKNFMLDNSDIEGSKPKKIYIRNNIGEMKYNYLDYSDIQKKKFKTSRHISPLNPIYTFKKNNNEIEYYGKIDKSIPKQIFPNINKESYCLKLNDIEGSNSGSLNKINKFQGNDFNLIIDDIKGTKSGSLKSGIFRKNNLNPLAPKYTYLSKDNFFEKKNTHRNDRNYNKLNRSKSFKISNNDFIEIINKNKLNNNKMNTIDDELIHKKKENEEIKKNEIDNEVVKKNKHFFGIFHDKNLCPRPIEVKPRDLIKNYRRAQKKPLENKSIISKNNINSNFDVLNQNHYKINFLDLKKNLSQKNIQNYDIKLKRNNSCNFSYEQKLDIFMKKNNLKHL